MTGKATLKFTMIALGIIVLITVMAWLFSPTLLPTGFGYVARQNDLQEAHLMISRPQWGRIHAAELALTLGSWRIHGTDLNVAYSLWPPRIERVSAQQVRVEQIARAGAQTAAADAPLPPLTEMLAYLQWLPPTIVERLDIALPTLDFVGTGQVETGPTGLALSLAGVQPALAAQFRVHLLVRPAGTASLDFFDQSQPGQPMLTIAATAADNSLQVQAGYLLADYPLQLVSQVLSLPVGSGQLQGELQTQLPWPLDHAAAASQKVTGRLQGDWRSDELGVQVGGLHVDIAGSLQQVDFVVHTGTVNMTDPALTLVAPKDLGGRYTPNGLELGEGIGYRLDWDAVTRAEGVLQALEIAWLDGFQISTSASFNGRFEDYVSSGTVAVTSQLRGDTVAAQVNVSRRDLNLPIQVSYNLATGQGRAAGQTKPYPIKKPLAHNLLDAWREPYDLISGMAQLSFDYAWDAQNADGQVQVVLQDAVASYETTVVSGIEGTLIFALQNDLLRLRPSQIRARELNSGVQFTDLAARLAWSGDHLSVQDATTRLLGGVARIAEIELDLAAMNSQFRVDLADLSLAEVLALEGDDIRGTGRLAGSLPMLLNQGELSMSNGRLTALPPGGKIELSSALAQATGQPGLDFAMRALTDFNYESLGVQADYSANGDLRLAVALLGRNPQVEKGRAIQYNLNISENVFDLLAALRAQQDITDRVEKKYVGGKAGSRQKNGK